MTPPDDTHGLPPEQDAVRRLLAEARHDEPVPPAVAARLDAVLAELAAERGPLAEQRARSGAPVVDLAARRRRAVATALLAAAAVVVAGVGVSQLGDLSGSMDAGAGSDAGGSSYGSDTDSKADAGAPSPAEEAAPNSREGAAVGAAAPAVSSDFLRRDLREAMRLTADLADAPQPDPTCDVAATLLDGGTAVPVVLDGRPAVAWYAVPQGARQQVDVYLCGTDVPAESVSLPVR